MNFIRKQPLWRTIVSLFILAFDVYMLGEIDMTNPMYVAMLFMILNFLWFYQYYKKD